MGTLRTDFGDLSLSLSRSSNSVSSETRDRVFEAIFGFSGEFWVGGLANSSKPASKSSKSLSSLSGDFRCGGLDFLGGEFALVLRSDFGEFSLGFATGWKARVFFVGVDGRITDSVFDFFTDWKARTFFLGGSGTIGGLGASVAGDTGFGGTTAGTAELDLRTAPGESTLFFRDIDGETSDDGVDGEDLVVLGPKYFIRSTSLDFLRVNIGEPSTLETEDGGPVLDFALFGTEVEVGKYFDKLTPCKADTSLLGSCLGFCSNCSFFVEEKNFDTSFSLLTPTIRGPSTADIIDCMLLWNFLASSFFIRLARAA